MIGEIRRGLKYQIATYKQDYHSLSCLRIWPDLRLCFLDYVPGLCSCIVPYKYTCNVYVVKYSCIVTTVISTIHGYTSTHTYTPV